MADGTLKLSPEYEDCKRSAKKYGKSLIEVMREVRNVQRPGRKL
jgi:uncharacterized protein (DUF111 family)